LDAHDRGVGRILYVGTGDNHSAPATEMSDAVLAITLDSGKILWAHQLLVGDMGNASCFSVEKVNCPEPHGPDYDLTAFDAPDLKAAKALLDELALG
jgi:polyvinyl alcohol dehydrogenase (cytochrome)